MAKTLQLKLNKIIDFNMAGYEFVCSNCFKTVNKGSVCSIDIKVINDDNDKELILIYNIKLCEKCYDEFFKV